jgi:hypothetical protein
MQQIALRSDIVSISLYQSPPTPAKTRNQLIVHADRFRDAVDEVQDRLFGQAIIPRGQRIINLGAL